MDRQRFAAGMHQRRAGGPATSGGRRWRGTTIVLAAAAAVAFTAAPAHAQAEPTLFAGSGQADITPPKSGYYLGGWTRADRRAEGQQSRLFAKAIVMQRGDRKVALVTVDLFMVPGGMQRHVTEALADRGLRADNVLMSATHTHAGPGGFANYPTLNTAAPNLTMVLTSPTALASLLVPVRADVQLYTFLVTQIAAAIRAADDDLAPAVAGWGDEQLVGLTQNRSLEAHLANHGILKPVRQGRVEDDPEGYVGTIDPELDVLRVDHVVNGQRVPIGAWSQFANHATVVKSEIRAYTGDHPTAAMQIFEAGMRREGNVPADRPVVSAFALGAEGDQTSGIANSGPAGADYVGGVEAAALMRAWREAGTAMSATPDLDLRWTQTCFCGQRSEGALTADVGFPGIPFLTGSEEGRGPLYDVTKVAWEGVTTPVQTYEGHGKKFVIPVGTFPGAVPLMTVRIGDRVIASLPGEPTKEVGARVKRDVLNVTGAAGVTKVVIAGLANEYINYITTPEEYDRQHYEGGSTMYGRAESTLLRASLADLAARMVRGESAPAPTIYDVKRGVTPTGMPYPEGAATGSITTQPVASVPRLGQAVLKWKGGLSGRDRPVGSAFIRAERLVGGVWREVDSDLGLSMLWRIAAYGAYSVRWEVPIDAAPGQYRLVVSATKYRLTSRAFLVTAAKSLTVKTTTASTGRVAVRVSYPVARENIDLRARPAGPASGQVRFTVGGASVVAPIVDGVASVSAPGTSAVTVAVGGATDAEGNSNAASLRVR